MSNGAVKVTARIRKFLPWENDIKCYEIENKTDIGLPAKEKGGKATIMGGKQVQQMNFMTFNDVFDRETENEDVFNGTAKKLCDNMIETGFNSLLFAYGQTGSGKTYTLLGNPGKSDGIKGVLQYAIEYLLNHPSQKVDKMSMSVIGVYATGIKKIEMFDLFDPQNVSKNGDWSTKKGERDIDAEERIKKEITKDTDVNKLITLAQSAAHYAPTGKNPQSSRGHTAFIIEVCMTDGHRCDFLVLDLAGSEGITAITPDFIKQVGEATAKVRLMEGGAINYGLQQINAILKEVGSKKGVNKTQGNGIRKLLHPFVQKANSPMITVLFTLSPSMTNIDTTRDTFRVATAMAGLKIKPVKVTKNKSKAEIIRELKKTIRDQELKISKLESEIVTLKEGVDDDAVSATGYTPVMKLQRQMTKQMAEVNHTTVSVQASSGPVTYNVNDLQGHKQGLMTLKRQLTTMMESGNDDDELLKMELQDINEEIDNTTKHIEDMKELESEMEKQIKIDNQRNSVLNKRQSGFRKFELALDGLAEEDEEEEEDEDDNAEFVKVNKADLMALKNQLDDLSKNMQIKKEKAKKRNQDLMAFVDKLQKEQKDLLNNLDSKIAKRKSLQ